MSNVENNETAATGPGYSSPMATTRSDGPGALRTPLRSGRSWFRRLAAVAAVSALGMAGLTPASQAATTFAVSALSASVHGSDVSASVTITASTATVAQRLKVCVRDARSAALDYVGLTDVAVGPAGTTYSATKAFPVGTYSYWGCVKHAEQWLFLGSPKTFTVVPKTTPTSLTSAMPATSTLPGWAYSYGQDFSTPAPLGQFSKVYGSRWAGYVGVRNDTSRNGSYQPDKVLSVSDGMLNMAIGYDAATDRYNVAAPFPQPPAGVNNGSPEYLGMRTSIRFKSSNPMPGYKVAWMLWPASWNWNDGEIDFPEASLAGDIWGFSHQANTGSPQVNALWARSPATFFDGWHTATTEWVPGKSVEFFLDGVSIGRTTAHVPTKPMHWALQTETALTATPPAKTTKGTISIDWLTVESYKP